MSFGLRSCLLDIPIEARVEELYDPNQRGIIAFPDVVPPFWRHTLLEEVREGPFTQAQREYGKALEEFEFFEETGRLTYPFLEELRKAANELYRRAGAVASFTGDGFNSTTLPCWFTWYHTSFG